MLGWRMRAMRRASRSNRDSASASAMYFEEMTLIATSCPCVSPLPQSPEKLVGWSARSRRRTHPQVEPTLDRRCIHAIVPVDEPPHYAISQLVGSSIADTSRCRVDDRPLQ